MHASLVKDIYLIADYVYFYSLCKNKSISKKVCFKPSLRSFIFVVTLYSKDYTNSDYTLNVLRKPRFFNYNGY